MIDATRRRDSPPRGGRTIGSTAAPGPLARSLSLFCVFLLVLAILASSAQMYDHHLPPLPLPQAAAATPNIGLDERLLKPQSSEKVSTGESPLLSSFSPSSLGVEISTLKQDQSSDPLALTAPMNLTRFHEQNTNPQLAASENGNIYIVWEDQASFQVLFSRSTDGGSTFTLPVYLNGQDDQSSDPKIVARNNDVYVVWSNGDTVSFSHSIDGGSTFMQPVTWGNTSSVEMSKGQLAVSRTGDVYVLLFSEDNRNQRIFLVKSTDRGTTFTEPVVVTSNATLGSSQDPQLVLDPRGAVAYVTWYEGDKVMFLKSNSDGISFSSNPQILFAGYTCSSNVSVSTILDEIFATCEFENEELAEGSIPGTHSLLHYRILLYTGSTDNGATFSSAVSLTNKIRSDVYFDSIVKASGDSAYIAYTNYNGQETNKAIYLIKVSDRQTVFHEPFLLNATSGYDKVLAGLEVEGSNVYVVWFDRSPTSDVPQQIFFSGSSDKGRTFSRPVRIGIGPSDSPHLSFAAVGSNLHFGWVAGNISNSVIQYSRLSPFPIGSLLQNDTESSQWEKSVIHRGVMLYNAQNFTEALGAFDTILELNPHNRAAWYDKGLALAALTRYAEAIQAFDNALAIDPNFIPALSNKAATLAQLGRYEEALQSYDMILQLTPNDASILTNEAATLAQLGRYEEALQSYDRALQIEPSHVNALIGKGAVFYDLGRYSDAVEWYEKALAVDPSNLNAQSGKELALAKMR